MRTRKSDPPKAAVGRALQQLREVRGLTQEDLTSAISRRHMGRLEQGHQHPSIGMLEQLADGLQVHPLTFDGGICAAVRFSVDRQGSEVCADRLE